MGTGPKEINDDTTCRIAVVGRGRLGSALALALSEAGHCVEAHGRDEAPDRSVDVVMLCVPDTELASAAAGIAAGPLLGHCSGASGLEVLGERPAFSLHPLMTITADAELGALRLRGAGAAIAATDELALHRARELATSIGMRPFELDPADRPAYHAAASVASNFLVTLEAAAERLAATAGVGRDTLAPLVRATVENWALAGAPGALTGPIARGDEETVAHQRRAVSDRTPELLTLFDQLCDHTRVLAGSAR